MSDETLKYKDETERRAALEALQEDETIDIDEKLRKIDEITNADVEAQEPEREYTEEELEEDGLEDIPPEDGEKKPDHPEEKKEAVGSSSEQTKTENAEKTAEEKRRWVIEEDDIPKETWYDRVERKNKPYVTQKNPKDLIQSYIHGQKRIHWLEDIQLPQQKEHEYKRGRAEAEKEWQEKIAAKEAEYKQKIDELTKRSSKNETTDQQNASESLSDILEKLNEIDPGDALERSEDIAKLNSQALTAALNQINSMGETIKGLQSGTLQPQAPEHTSGSHQQPQQQNLSQVWEGICRDVDTFVSSEECPQELKISRPYSQVTDEVMRFQRELAQLYTAQLGPDGRLNVMPIEKVGNAEMEAATAAYLTGLPQLMQRVQQYGFQEPQDFRTWIELDQIEGLRSGWVRDPQSKQWVQASGVKHPDLRSATDYYYRSTGKAQQQQQKREQQVVEDFASAVSRRDNRVVQMDTSRSVSGDHNAITERQAWEILEGEQSIDREDAIREAWQGKREKLELLNQALERLGQPVIPTS